MHFKLQYLIYFEHDKIGWLHHNVQSAPDSIKNHIS